MSRLQLNFNGGEIDPDEYERVDLDLYDTGLALGLNVISRPHGGLSGRPGLAYFARLKRTLESTTVLSENVTMDNGGSESDFAGGIPIVTSTAMPATSEYVVASLTFDDPREFAVVDIDDFYLDDGSPDAGVTPPGNGTPGGGGAPSEPLPGYDDDIWNDQYSNGVYQKPGGPDPSVSVLTYANLRVQFENDGTWYDFGPPQDFGPSLRSRRFAENYPRAAKEWRVVVDNKDVAGGVFRAARIAFMKEDKDQSAAKQMPFAFSSDQYYSIWLSDQNAEIFANGQFLASVAIPHKGADLARVTYEQSLDTLILYHPDYDPHRILRSGRHTAWDSRPQPYENIPLFDYTGLALNGEDAQQQLRFTDYVNGDVFNLTFAGETTRSITYSGSPASAVQSALSVLKNLRNGTVSVSGTGTLLTIDFTGKNGSQEWPEMFGRTIKSDSGGVVASTVRRGAGGGENVMSDTRGWPRCGAFFQQRQFLGGFKSRPGTIGASVLGDYFNLNTDLESPDVGLDFTLDGTGVVEIRHIVAGRNLLIFTASAEFFVPSEAITRDDFRIRQASAVGCRSNIRPIIVDGPALFIERRSGALRAFVYSESEQSYVPEVISMHASHLLPNPIDMKRRPARRSREADLIIIPNRAPDPAAMLTLLRTHNIVAFTRMVTDGEILAVGIENEAGVEMAVVRNGEVNLEVFHDDCYLDASLVEEAIDDGIDRMEAAHLEGLDVVVMQDGAFVATVTVENGEAVFPEFLTGSIEVGLRFDVEFKTLPLRKSSEDGGFRKDRYRIVKAHFFFETCPAFEVSANDSKFYRYEPQRPGMTLDKPLPGHVGEVIAAGFPGSSVRPDLHFRLFRPGPFHLRSLDLETSQ